jgi:hypothetical protein
MEKNGIEWDEVKDNLKVFEVDEKNLIELGNPFQTGRPGRSGRQRVKTVYVEAPLPKWYVALVVILILMTGFFFVKSQTASSGTQILQNVKVSTLELFYSPEFEPVDCHLSVQIDREHLEKYIELPFLLEPFLLEPFMISINFTNISNHELHIHSTHQNISLQPGTSYQIFIVPGEEAVVVSDPETNTTYKIIIKQSDPDERQNRKDSN